MSASGSDSKSNNNEINKVPAALKKETMDFGARINLSRHDFLGIFGKIFTNRCEKGGYLVPKNATKFHANVPPGISVNDYIARFYQYGNMSSEAMVLAFFYMRKISFKFDNLKVCILNFHRLYCVACLVAANYFDDAPKSDKDYAEIGGLTIDPNEIIVLRSHFLSYVDELTFSMDDYRDALLTIEEEYNDVVFEEELNNSKRQSRLISLIPLKSPALKQVSSKLQEELSTSPVSAGAGKEDAKVMREVSPVVIDEGKVKAELQGAIKTILAASLKQEKQAIKNSGTRIPIVETVGASLDRVCQANAGRVQRKECILRVGDTSFDAKSKPPISISEYVARVAYYAETSEEAIILSLIYIDRVIIKNPSILLTVINVHRLFLAACLVAGKFFDDDYYNNSFYAKLGGVPTSEMNQLEKDFLGLNDYNLYVSPGDYKVYAEQMAVAYNKNIGPRVAAKKLSFFNEAAAQVVPINEAFLPVNEPPKAEI